MSGPHTWPPKSASGQGELPSEERDHPQQYSQWSFVFSALQELYHQSREPLELTEGNSSGVRVFYMHTALSLVFYTHLPLRAHVHKRKPRLRGEMSPTQMTGSHRARLDPKSTSLTHAQPGGGARGGLGHSHDGLGGWAVHLGGRLDGWARAVVLSLSRRLCRRERPRVKRGGSSRGAGGEVRGNYIPPRTPTAGIPVCPPGD